MILSLCAARRLGIVKIILEKNFPLSISAAISAAAKSLREHAPRIEATPAVEKQVLDFLLERARYILRERRGFAYDEINAAFAAGADDLVDAVERVAALKAIRDTKNFAPLAAASSASATFSKNRRGRVTRGREP